MTALRAIFDFTAQGQHDLGIMEPHRFYLQYKRGEKDKSAWASEYSKRPAILQFVIA